MPPIATTLKLDLDLATLRTHVESGETIDIRLARGKEYDALGLKWRVDEVGTDGRVFAVSFPDGQLRVGLAEGAKISATLDGVSEGPGIKFKIGRFLLTQDGIDIDAEVDTETAVKLQGVNTSFRFTSGGFRIERSRLVSGHIAGAGALPPDLVGEARAKVSMTFGANPEGSIEIVSAAGELDMSGAPLEARATRFKLSISELGFAFVKSNGYHFYFLLTGSAEWAPGAGEFNEGFLKYLPSLKIELHRCPLAGDAKELARHIAFQVPVPKRGKTKVFEAFEFELRGIGFHPNAEEFGGTPALCLSGQFKFAAIGDVASPKIDFHGLWIAPPASGESLPRIRCDGLTVDLALSGNVKISGTTQVVDGRLPSLFASDTPAGKEIKAHGFLGAGKLEIEGWASMSAAMGFVEVTQKDGSRTPAMFLFVKREKMSEKIPTPVAPLFLREVGFGFGAGFTLAAIEAIDSSGSLADIIKHLDEISKRQGELGSFAAWKIDENLRNITLAMTGLVTVSTSQGAGEQYDESKERDLPNPLLLHVVAALRSDLTFFMSPRVWLNTNYNDYLVGDDTLRTNPFMTGYLYYSPRRQELLARVIKERNSPVGIHPKMPEQLQTALGNLKCEGTLYIKPGLFHFELGWPDKIEWSMDAGPISFACKGGLIYRIQDDAILQGVNFAARGRLRLGGQAGSGSLGVSIYAEANVAATVRTIAVIDARYPGRSMLYGAVSLNANLNFSVSAWLEIDALFDKIRLSIDFSFSIQIDAAVEVALVAELGIGARARARVGVSAFGCTLSVEIDMAVAGGLVDDARARVNRYLAIQLDSAAAPPGHSNAIDRGDGRVALAAAQSQSAAVAAANAIVAPAASAAGAGAPLAQAAVVNHPINFYAVIRVSDGNAPRYWYVALFPRRKETRQKSAYFGVKHEINFVSPVTVQQWDSAGKRFVTKTLSAGLQSLDVDNSTILSGIEWAPGNLTMYQLVKSGYLKHGEEPVVRNYEIVPEANSDANARADHQRAGASQFELEPKADIYANDLQELTLACLFESLDAMANGVSPNNVDKRMPHVVDTGLTFRFDRSVDAQAFVLALESATIVTTRPPGAPVAAQGTIKCFNPTEAHFENSNPTFDGLSAAVKPDGIALSWDLKWPTNDKYDKPEYHLRYYEIERVLVGRADGNPHLRSTKVKAAHLIGKGYEVLSSGLQFVDDLSDLDADERIALLDSGDAGAEKWEKSIRASTVDIEYRVVPVCTAGTRGAGVRHRVQRTKPVRRPAALKSSKIEFKFKDVPLLASAGLPNDYACDMEFSFEPSNSAPTQPTAQRLELVFRREKTVPAGSYGTDAETVRASSPADLRRDLAQDMGGGIDFTWLSGEGFASPLKLPAQAAKAIVAHIHGDATNQGPFACRVIARVVGAGLIKSDPFEVPIFVAIAAAVKSGAAASPLPLVDPPAPPPPLLISPPRVELPVRLQMPWYAFENLDAKAGALFVACPDSAGNLKPLRDPKRRMAASLTWTALFGADAGAGDSHPHWSTRYFAGYEIRELDVDAHPDPSTPFIGEDGKVTDPGKSNAWADISREIAHVALTDRANARLSPADARDASAFEAHYPSQTFRFGKDRKRGWWSRADSIPDWPKWMVPTGLMPKPDNILLDGLFAKGVPKSVEISCGELGGQGLTFHQGWKQYYKVPNGGNLTSTDGKLWTLERVGAALDLPWLRSALATIVADWNEQARSAEVSFVSVLDDGSRLEAIRRTIPLASRHHRLLAELVARLTVDGSTMGRRYDIVVQPDPETTATTASAFMAETQEAADPYGWKILQTLGLAIGFKSFDRVTNEYEAPRLLKNRIVALIEPMRGSYGAAKGDIFVDCLLQPDALYAVAPVDGDAPETADLNGLLDDRGLAAVQVELRPRVCQVASYTKPAGKPWEQIPNVDPMQTPWADLGAPFEALDPLSPEFQTQSDKKIVERSEWDGLLEAMARRWPDAAEAKSNPTKKRLLLEEAWPWSARFLAHSVGEPPLPPTLCAFCVAMPVRQRPLRRAPDTFGRISIYVPIAHRWGTTLRYAVRPFGRYDWIAAAAGYTKEIADSIAWPRSGKKHQEWAEISVPRTEKPAKPVVLTPLRRSDPTNPEGDRPDIGHFVGFATHPDAILAQSNVTMLARLGKSQFRTTILRRYRHTAWKNTVATTLALNSTDLEDPSPRTDLPPVPLPSVTSDAELLRRFGEYFGDLWRGGDIRILEDMPYCYEHAVDAQFVADASQSEWVTAAAAGGEYRLPDPTMFHLEWDISYVGIRPILTAKWPALRHRDCMPDRARALWGLGNSSLDLPDPGIGYSLAIKAAANPGEVAPFERLANVAAIEGPSLYAATAVSKSILPVPAIRVSSGVLGDQGNPPTIEVAAKYDVGLDGDAIRPIAKIALLAGEIGPWSQRAQGEGRLLTVSVSLDADGNPDWTSMATACQQACGVFQPWATPAATDPVTVLSRLATVTNLAQWQAATGSTALTFKIDVLTSPDYPAVPALAAAVVKLDLTRRFLAPPGQFGLAARQALRNNPAPHSREFHERMQATWRGLRYDAFPGAPALLTGNEAMPVVGWLSSPGVATPDWLAWLCVGTVSAGLVATQAETDALIAGFESSGPAVLPTLEKLHGLELAWLAAPPPAAPRPLSIADSTILLPQAMTQEQIGGLPLIANLGAHVIGLVRCPTSAELQTATDAPARNALAMLRQRQFFGGGSLAVRAALGLAKPIDIV